MLESPPFSDCRPRKRNANPVNFTSRHKKKIVYTGAALTDGIRSNPSVDNASSSSLKISKMMIKKIKTPYFYDRKRARARIHTHARAVLTYTPVTNQVAEEEEEEKSIAHTQ